MTTVRDWFGRGRRWLVVAILLSLALRWPFFRLPMISDEGSYAHVARRWLDGRGELYGDLWVSRPQGIFTAYGLIQNTLGFSVFDLRFGAWLASALTLVFVWRYAREWAGPAVAALTAILLATVAAAPAIEGFTANAEVFLALPSAIAAWFLLRLPADRWLARHLVLIGGLAGIATLLKPSGLVMLPVALGFVWLEGAAGVRVALRRTGLVLAGCALGLAPAVLHGVLIGWDDFLFASITYRIDHQSSLTASPLHHLRQLAALLYHSWWLLLAVLIPLWGRQRAIHGRLIAALPGGLRAFGRSVLDPASIRRRINQGGRDPGGTLLRLWLLGCLAGIAMGGDWWAHYLIQIAGPLAIGLAVLLRDAAPAVAPDRRLAFGTAVALLLCLPFRVIAAGGPDQISLALFRNTAYPYHDEVARYLRDETPPDATIYVAFNDAALYYLADRASPYRYLFNQELLAFPTAQSDLIAMLSGPGRPDYIVKSGMPSPFPDDALPFWTAVDRHYRVQAIIGPMTVYRAAES